MKGASKREVPSFIKQRFINERMDNKMKMMARENGNTLPQVIQGNYA